jgi:hypothetical protein
MMHSSMRAAGAALALLALPSPAALAAPAGPTRAVTSACVWYAAPDGVASHTGRSANSPLSLADAMTRPQAGDVVCLEPGTYVVATPLYLTRSGTEQAPIVYRSEAGKAIVKRARGGSANEVFRAGSGVRHVQLEGLTIDGSNVAQNGVLCDRATHLRVLDSTILNVGAGGIVSLHCDYLTVDGNRLWHVGYGRGWSSAISLNTSVAADGFAGFHSYITNNVVGGTDDNSGKNSDGNGIIVDNGGDTPAVLIANNLVYMNYGRCVHSFNVARVWVVNNTCYENGLREPHSQWGTGEISYINCTRCAAVNNVVRAWTYGNPYREERASTVRYSHDVYFGGRQNMVPEQVGADPNQLRRANPGFKKVVAVSPTAADQWSHAPKPWTLALGFVPKAGSPLVNTGVDPRTVGGMTAAMKKGFTAAMQHDLAGKPRAHGRWDVGAFER